RRPRDLVSAALGVLGIITVMLLAIYARSTVVGVVDDAANNTSSILRTVLFLPFSVIEGLISFFLPVAVIGELVWKRRWRTLLTALVAGLSSIVASTLLLWVFTKYFSSSLLTEQLTESFSAISFLELLPYVSVLSALLAVTGGHKKSRIVSIGWPLLFFVVIISVLQGNQTLPGAVITVLIGLVFGELSRYLIGADPQRALGIDLVRLVHRANIQVKEIVRIDTAVALSDLRAWRISTNEPLGFVDKAGQEALRDFIDRVEDFELPGLSHEEARVFVKDAEETIRPSRSVDPARHAVALRRKYHPVLGSSASRNYLVVDASGKVYHAAVLDADTQIVGLLAGIWDKVRFRTVTRRSKATISEQAEQIVLMELAARDTELVSERTLRVGNTDNSYIVLFSLSEGVPLSDERHGEITDEALDGFWRTLEVAHNRGISHGNITADCVALLGNRLEINHWEAGSIAASEVARRVDMAQGLAMLAVVVGADRAVQSARRCLSPDLLVSTAPMLQRAIIPHVTTAAFTNKGDLQKLRALIIEDFGEDLEVEPMQLHRFSAKTVVTAVIGLVAVYLLLGSINFEDLKATVSHAKPVWLVVAFGFSLLTYLGAGLMLKIFTAEKISLRDSTFVQLAASVVSLVAPAGIGHAALNLRFLQKQKVPTPIAVATVSVVQVFQFLTTVIFLIVLALVTGDVRGLEMPSSSVLVAIGLLIAVIVAILLIKPVRLWIFEKIRPYVDQVWPRLVWLATNPRRIAWGVASALILTMGYVGAFAASLYAFDYSLPIMTLAITYLVSNSIGSVVPSPGGIGPIEAALTAGLTVAGVPYSIAFSAAIVYRVLTFWAPVPIGWVCLRFLQKKGIV
ncbi:MAG: flippase-like domain-containing protein, partial [Actinomycetaceae bacterium]|nr:flippase-like domain-containing protein [Actinomycetaceae bacterium]